MVCETNGALTDSYGVNNIHTVTGAGTKCSLPFMSLLNLKVLVCTSELGEYSD